MNPKAIHERYERQVTLKGFGEAAQNALLRARVLVIGAGGLGCPVLQYLTAAGTGCIGVVDDDVVTVSNLHRQVLYDGHDADKQKVAVAAAKLRQMNPDTEIEVHPVRLTQSNCLDMISGYDIVVDCTDNFASRYMINDACVLQEKPLVFAAVNRFEGQVAVFNWCGEDRQRSGNYRHLFPDQPAQGAILNCAEAGVLGVLPGIIGSMQAAETIKLVTGIGQPLVNQLLTYNALDNSVFVYRYDSQSPANNIPLSRSGFLQMVYEDHCINENNFTINAAQFDAMRLQKNTRVIDVREPHELPVVTEFEYTRVALNNLKQELGELGKDNVIFFCQSGARSLQAAATAAEYFKTSRFYSLQGGITAWKKLHQEQNS